MNRIAVLMAGGSVSVLARAKLDMLAQQARTAGLPLHFYLITDDAAELAAYRHVSVEFVPVHWLLSGWFVARLLQRLLVNYDVACFAGLPPACAFLARSGSAKTLEWRNSLQPAFRSFSIAAFFWWRAGRSTGYVEPATLYAACTDLLRSVPGEADPM